MKTKTSVTPSSVAFVMISAILLFMVSGCATGTSKVYEKDGRKYGATAGTFRDRWWNYYERGESYLEGGFYKEAGEDFSQAARMRDKDGRRARTYGMHFVDYFPHRGLGIAYLGLGRAQDAVRELELSLSQEETAKAKFYLNKARKDALSGQGKGSGGVRIALASPAVTTTNSLSFKVSGKASSSSYVSSIRINGRAIFLELSDTEVSFERTIELAEGENIIKIEASDLLGGTASTTVTVVADRLGPVIELESPGEQDLVGGGRLTVSGAAYDGSGVVSLTVNGKRVDARGGPEVSFNESADLPSGGVVEVTATDRAGNKTTATLSPPALTGGGYQGRALYAALGGMLAKAPNLTGRPVISLKGFSESQDVYYDTALVEGSVSGGADIASFTINGEPVISHKGRKIFFNRIVPLKEGENVVTLLASDTAGHRATLPVRFNRLPLKAHSVGSRMSVSVMPFKLEKQTDAAGVSYDAFVNAVVGLGRFNLVERAMLEQVLQEQALSQEALVDPATAARLGKVVSAEYVLIGDIHEDARSVEAFIRLVDTETSEVVVADDVYAEDKGLKGLTELMEGLAVKLRNGFPLVEGIVLKRDGATVVFDIGSKSGIRKNMGMLIFREGEHIKHPVTGKDLGAPSVLLGKARITEVQDEFSVAEIVRAEGAAKAMDLVITR